MTRHYAEQLHCAYANACMIEALVWRMCTYTVHCANGIGEQHLCKVTYNIYVMYNIYIYIYTLLCTDVAHQYHLHNAQCTHAPHQGLYHNYIIIYITVYKI